MSDQESTYLDTFSNWLRSLGEDAEALGTLLSVETASEGVRSVVAGGLNYVFKSLDLIPDGIDDIGYLDDAFVLRVSADLSKAEDLSGVDGDKKAQLNRLAGDCAVIEKFLEEDYPRLVTYVKGLRTGAARGRSVGEIVKEPAVCEELLADLSGFAKEYESPSFSREEKNLIKLRAFFSVKLPR